MKLVAYICDCRTAKVPCYKQPPNHPVHCSECGKRLIGIRLTTEAKVNPVRW